MTRLLALTLVACALASNPAAATTPQEPPDTLSAADVLRLAIDHSPALSAALLELERAGLAVEGEEHRYRATFDAALGYLRLGEPSLGQAGISLGASEALMVDAGVRHTTDWGLRLEGRLELAGDVSRTTAPDGIRGDPVGPGYGVALRLSVTQPLLRGLGRDFGRAGLDAARARRESATSAKSRVASEVAQAVLNAYWELWYAQNARHIQRQALRAAEQALKEAETRANAGVLARMEVLPLATEVAQIEEAIVAADAEVRRRQLDLARYIGAPWQREFTAASAGPEVAPEPAEELIVALVLDHAFELRELEGVVEAAKIEARLAGELVRPRLDASAWLSLAGLGDRDPGAALAMFGRFEAVGAFVGLTFELPFDRTLERAALARANLAVEVARERLRDATERLTMTALDAAEVVRAARRRVELAERTTSLAREAADGQLARFAAGTITVTDWLLAEQQRRQAELRIARSQADLVLADVRLKHLMGVLLDGQGDPKDEP